MIIECPRCSARYRVEDEVLKDEPTFKCSRCSHIFAYEGGEVPPPRSTPRAGGRPASAETESLSFAFAETAASSRASRQDPEEPDGDEDADSRASDKGLSNELEEPEGASAEEDVFEARDENDEFVFDDDAEVTEDGEEDPEPDAPDEDQPRFVRGEDELRIDREPERKPHRPYLIFLALLVLVWANLALYLRNHPTEAGEALSRIPVAGRWLTEDHLLQMRIHLQEVKGSWQRIKDDRPVFIVSGLAVNTSPQPLKGVQIESTLLGDDGRVLDGKNIFCGNAMSMKIVKDLSSKEISLLQRLEPPQRFEIAPGESTAFTVVFMEPPAGVREFTAQVVAAQKTT